MKAADYNIGFFDNETRQYIKEFSGAGFVFKDYAAFKNKSADVCYIPESYEIHYVFADFMRIAKGNTELAEYLFSSADSQRPELLFDELVCQDIIEEDGTITQSYEKEFSCLPIILYWF
jgi:hypothetical protein